MSEQRTLERIAFVAYCAVVGLMLLALAVFGPGK